MAPVTAISAHDFLYGDRHKKFYPDIKIYLGGTLGPLPAFIALLEQGKSAKEICEELKLAYRGDVWFATLLVYFHVRDGLVELPNLSVDIPPELVDNMDEYERAWQRRHIPPDFVTRH